MMLRSGICACGLESVGIMLVPESYLIDSQSVTSRRQTTVPFAAF